MTGGDLAGLIAAGVFAVLVALLAIPILKLGRVFDELRVLIRDLNDETEPLFEELTRTVATTNSQLEKVDVITDSVSDASANVSAMTSLVASTVGQPIIKTAAFSSGVRRAFSADAVRARREQRHRARDAEHAAASTAAPAAGPGAEPEADGAAGSRSSEDGHGAPPASPGAGGPAAARETGARTAWWEGTEWDTAPAPAPEPDTGADTGRSHGPVRASGADETMESVITDPHLDPHGGPPVEPSPNARTGDGSDAATATAAEERGGRDR